MEHKTATHTLTFTFTSTDDKIIVHTVRSGDMDIDIDVHEMTDMVRDWCDHEDIGFDLFIDANERRN